MKIWVDGIDYKPGWTVYGVLRERWEGTNPQRDVLTVYVTVDSLIDFDNGEPLAGTSHQVEYTKDVNGLWWATGIPWGNQPDTEPLVDIKACVYDAVLRFEIHELQHQLKMRGKCIVDPHPECSGGTNS